MKNPKISIIVPVYNAGKYLNQCIDSLIQQTYTNLDIIFICNKSTDNSLQILQKYQKLDDRITIIEKDNEGVSVARNRGLEVAIGDYIMFVDADDWIDLDNCEKAINIIVEEQADVLMWSYVREFENKSSIKEIFNQEKIVFIGDDLKRIHRQFFGVVNEEKSRPENADALCPVWGKLYRRELITDNHISFVDLQEIGTYEDGFFNIEVFNYARKAVYVNEFFYHYRKTNNSSITSRYKPNLSKQWLTLFSKMNNYIDSNNLDNEYIEGLNNRIAMSILGLGLNELNSDKKSIKIIKNVHEIIYQNQYRLAYKQFDLNYLPLHWKVFYGCAKYKFSLGVYLLLICIRKAIGN